jgi:Zn ribbon nucleic-acid-binding protein
MSSNSQQIEQIVCSQCNSENAYSESFHDEEIGHIDGCFDCGYYDVYREREIDKHVIEDYQGYNHHYKQQDIDKERENDYQGYNNHYRQQGIFL